MRTLHLPRVAHVFRSLNGPGGGASRGGDGHGQSSVPISGGVAASAAASAQNTATLAPSHGHGDSRDVASSGFAPARARVVHQLRRRAHALADRAGHALGATPGTRSTARRRRACAASAASTARGGLVRVHPDDRGAVTEQRREVCFASRKRRRALDVRRLPEPSHSCNKCLARRARRPPDLRRDGRRVGVARRTDAGGRRLHAVAARVTMVHGTPHRVTGSWESAPDPPAASRPRAAAQRVHAELADQQRRERGGAVSFLIFFDRASRRRGGGKRSAALTVGARGTLRRRRRHLRKKWRCRDPRPSRGPGGVPARHVRHSPDGSAFFAARGSWAGSPGRVREGLVRGAWDVHLHGFT